MEPSGERAFRVLPPVERQFRTLARTIVPEASRLDERGWSELQGIVEEALASRPRAMRRQLRLLIRLLGWLSVARYGRTFGALDEVRRRKFLEAVERSSIVLLRRGFWGLRTLVLMGYWARPAAAAEIGYRAHPRGWSERR